jgi:hypothetical protein
MIKDDDAAKKKITVTKKASQQTIYIASLSFIFIYIYTTGDDCNSVDDNEIYLMHQLTPEILCTCTL